MRDSVALKIGSRQISNFLSYEADSNVLVPADAFTCRIGMIDSAMIKTGAQFQLEVNGQFEMTGIIDRISTACSKGSQEMNIEGRDLMGLLVDSYVEYEDWKTLREMKLKALGKRLLKNIPFLDKSKVIYGTEKKDSGLSKKKKVKRASSDIFSDTTTNVCQFELGTSVFEALSDYAQRHGLLMWMEPDGTLVFGELKGLGDSVDYTFYLYKDRENSSLNNIISATKSDDISKRYSKITTVAQIQGTDSFDVDEHTVAKTAYDKSFPFRKPLVLQSTCSSERAAAYQVKLEMKKREAEGWRYEITVAGHSQDNVNYRANSVCYVRDEMNGIDERLLILGRKFTLNRQDGPRTELTMGRLIEGYTAQ